METNKKNPVIAIISLVVVLLLAYLVAVGNRLGLFDKIVDRSATKGEKTTSKENSENWLIYRNEEYGFEVEYPGRFAVNRQTGAQNTAADADCGGLVDDTFEIFLDPDSKLPSYGFSIYSNPLALTPKDFFFCRDTKIQGDVFEGKIEVLKAGKDDYEAVLAVEGGTITALLSYGGNIYEIRQKAEAVGASERAELDKILSTVKISGVEPDPITEENKNFCASETKNEYGDGILAFSAPIKSGSDPAEFFVGCGTATSENPKQWLASEPVALYHVVEKGKGGYNISWSGSTGKEDGGLDWIYSVAPVSAGDLDGDGLDEIFFSGKGSCVQNCSQWCLYLPGEKDLFCVVSFTRTQSLGDDADIAMEGRICTTDSSAGNCKGECTVLARTLCFDENVQESRYKIFKEYLEKSIAPGI